MHIVGPAPSGDFWFLLVASKGTRRRQGIWGKGDFDFGFRSWSSLAQGFFSGLLTRENINRTANTLTVGCAQVYGHEENFNRLERATELAGDRGKTVAQIALAYLFNQPLNVFTVSGCRSVEESRLNREAMEIRLTPEELDWLDLRSECR